VWQAEEEGASWIEIVEGEAREWGAVGGQLVQVVSLWE